jgi:predicted CoA-binding protein
MDSILATDEQVHSVIKESRIWFVVGLGANPDRPAFRVARFLQSIGKLVIPIHPRAEAVHGQSGYASIADAAIDHGAPDVVDVFVRSDRAGEFADAAIEVGAKAVWFQLGVIDHDAAQRVHDAGLLMVMDRCPAIEHPRVR